MSGSESDPNISSNLYITDGFATETIRRVPLSENKYSAIIAELYTCSWEILTASLKTVHVTASLQGGVVREPL